MLVLVRFGRWGGQWGVANERQSGRWAIPGIACHVNVREIACEASETRGNVLVRDKATRREADAVLHESGVEFVHYRCCI